MTQKCALFLVHSSSTAAIAISQAKALSPDYECKILAFRNINIENPNFTIHKINQNNAYRDPNAGLEIVEKFELLTCDRVYLPHLATPLLRYIWNARQGSGVSFIEEGTMYYSRRGKRLERSRNLTGWRQCVKNLYRYIINRAVNKTHLSYAISFFIESTLGLRYLPQTFEGASLAENPDAFTAIRAALDGTECFVQTTTPKVIFFLPPMHPDYDVERREAITKAAEALAAQDHNEAFFTNHPSIRDNVYSDIVRRHISNFTEINSLDALGCIFGDIDLTVVSFSDSMTLYCAYASFYRGGECRLYHLGPFTHDLADAVSYLRHSTGIDFSHSIRTSMEHSEPNSVA